MLLEELREPLLQQQQPRRQRQPSSLSKTFNNNSEDDNDDIEENNNNTNDDDDNIGNIEDGNDESPSQQKWVLFEKIFPPLFLPNEKKQLSILYHFVITFIFWLIIITMALLAPSLGDVLNLVGCATGTLIAFVFPALASLRIRQGGTPFMLLPSLLLFVGGIVGCMGTYFAVIKIIRDSS